MAVRPRTPRKVNMDRLSRSQQMSLVRAKHTKPELAVRRYMHSLGLRFRLHDKSLSGAPDIVFKSRRAVLQVRGCFWHWHEDPNCRLSRRPKSRQEFWIPKLRRNQERDHQNDNRLRAEGWHVFVIWECQLQGADTLAATGAAILRLPQRPCRSKPNQTKHATSTVER
jgi:DNA mismatch endonuclease, patch repair protein